MSYLFRNTSYKKSSIRILLPIALFIGAFLISPNMQAGVFGKKKKKSKAKDGCGYNHRKGPNVRVASKSPTFKTRGEHYTHLMSRKNVSSVQKQQVFSYTEPRYNLFPNEQSNKKKVKKENNGRQVQP